MSPLISLTWIKLTTDDWTSTLAAKPDVVLVFWKMQTMLDNKKDAHCELRRIFKIDCKQRNVIHRGRAVCCGDRTGRVFHSGWKLGGKVFYDPATFHSLQPISHKAEVSVSYSRLSLLFLPSSSQVCLFFFFRILTFLPSPSLCILALGNFLTDLKPLLP